MSVGPFQESDGSVSMRRILAAFFSIGAVAVLIIGAINASMAAVYGGAALLVAVVLLLLFTTWGDVAEIAKAWKGAK
jgi:hypothetical protein